MPAIWPSASATQTCHAAIFSGVIVSSARQAAMKAAS